ncbi:Pleckstrin homology domain containing protein [Oryctes borbonicus]|uniref:Pleckstrin homology domain containing protein n=1 Tax=Oryctes borbonicus TaxID=1629725 RepID=A0A0T6B7L3_9SCAR|nr:Pleckstrin homology domain containing protein [Oryctes borbonicus]
MSTDPKIKANLRKHLLSHGDSDMAAVHKGGGGGGGGGNIGSGGALTNTVYAHQRPEPAIHQTHAGTNGSCPEQEPLLSSSGGGGGNVGSGNRLLDDEERLQWEPLLANNEQKPKGQPKFEAFTMTGEYIINISRTQQSLLPKQQKKVDNLRYHNSHTHHLRHQHNSVPNSPNEMDIGYRKNYCKSGSNSANTSPVSANKRDSNPSPISENAKSSTSFTNNFVRTSRSEDQLQDTKNMSAVDIEIDDDVTSSLNTLLDTRPDSGSTNNVCSSSNSDRIVWTYNAPVTTISEQHKLAHTLSNGSSSSHTSPSSTSPLRSGSPASPTSMSSSVMSSHSGSRRYPYTLTNGPHTDSGQYNQTNGDFSVSEAISNISSPDYHDDDSMGIRDCVMEISDHSDSDSTLLVSEPRHRHAAGSGDGGSSGSDHRIVIQVKGPDKDSNLKDRGAKFKTSNDTLDQDFDDDRDSTCRDSSKEQSPTNSSEDDSDVDSLLSFHYSPKAVDMPSAIRLAKRLYSLDGFKKSDVSRHLSKNNDFSRAVGDEYLKYFDFEQDTLDIALRKFLKQFPLTGETQERERVLVPFSKRFLDCNPGSFNSQDAVHTLTCAIMLLNTDLHGQNINRKMTCNEFIENLSGLNEKENFPREVLKQLYHAIKNNPLEWALDDDVDETNTQTQLKANDQNVCGNPFLEVPSFNATEYKKGYVMRKCCYEANAKRSLCCIFLAPFHKRSWKMFYCTLRDLVLYLHKDENGFRKNQMGDNFHNAIRIHHALATPASDYTKKQYVFRLQTADQAEYLFQTSDSKELQSWIDTINFVCASFSAPPLEAAVGSQKKFQRPLLPCSHTKLSLREQLREHEERVMRLENELEEHRKAPPERGAKSLIIQNYKEKEVYLIFELRRYSAYVNVLKAHVSRFPDTATCVLENSIGEMEDEASGVSLLEGNIGSIVPPPIPERKSPTINRKRNLMQAPVHGMASIAGCRMKDDTHRRWTIFEIFSTIGYVRNITCNSDITTTTKSKIKLKSPHLYDIQKKKK